MMTRRLAALVLILLTLAGCGSSRTTRIATGAAGGAVTGVVLGGGFFGLVIGGAIGGAGGALLEEGLDEQVKDAGG